MPRFPPAYRTEDIREWSRERRARVAARGKWVEISRRECINARRIWHDEIHVPEYYRDVQYDRALQTVSAYGKNYKPRLLYKCARGAHWNIRD